MRKPAVGRFRGARIGHRHVDGRQARRFGFGARLQIRNLVHLRTEDFRDDARAVLHVEIRRPVRAPDTRPRRRLRSCASDDAADCSALRYCLRPNPARVPKPINSTRAAAAPAGAGSSRMSPSFAGEIAVPLAACGSFRPAAHRSGAPRRRARRPRYTPTTAQPASCRAFASIIALNSMSQTPYLSVLVSKALSN